MTEIEKQALALINEVALERSTAAFDIIDRRTYCYDEAICRAIERLEAFRKQVSDAVEELLRHEYGLNLYAIRKIKDSLSHLVIAKPDPLIEAFRDAFSGTAIGKIGGYRQIELNFREALAARGLEVVEKKP